MLRVQILLVLYSIELTTKRPSRTKRCIIDKFQDVLLVLNFNFPYYENVQKLRAMYDGVFGQVVICGDLSDAWKGSFPHIVKDKAYGDLYLSYHCMGKAIGQYPGFKGEYSGISLRQTHHKTDTFYKTDKDFALILQFFGQILLLVISLKRTLP